MGLRDGLVELIRAAGLGDLSRGALLLPEGGAAGLAATGNATVSDRGAAGVPLPGVERRWDRIPVVCEHHRRSMVGGEPERYGNFIQYALERWGGSLGAGGVRVLLVGVDPADEALPALLSSPRVTALLCVDPEAEPARVRAGDRLVDPRVEWRTWADGDGAWPPVDVVVAWNALHRTADLEGFFRRMLAALTSGGLLVLRDYVGPNRFQFSDGQVLLLNALLQAIPEPLRCEADGRLRTRQVRPSAEWLARIAPGLAVRSEQILTELRRHMKILEFQPLGGTLIAPMLDGIVDGFMSDTPASRQVMEALLQAEMTLIEGHLLASDYCYAITRKPY